MNETLRELYERLAEEYGERCEPDVWWPVRVGASVPPVFERTITNVLVTQTKWEQVASAVESLGGAGLLTAAGLAAAKQEQVETLIKPVGFKKGKAKCIRAIAAFVLERFGTEAAFVAGVTREQLLPVWGVGPETADRTILYTCGRLAWPVDTYCRRVLAHHGAIEGLPDNASAAERRREAAEIVAMVEAQIPRTVRDWQRLHALMQLEGEAIR